MKQLDYKQNANSTDKSLKFCKNLNYKLLAFYYAHCIYSWPNYKIYY